MTAKANPTHDRGPAVNVSWFPQIPGKVEVDLGKSDHLSGLKTTGNNMFSSDDGKLRADSYLNSAASGPQIDSNVFTRTIEM